MYICMCINCMYVYIFYLHSCTPLPSSLISTFSTPPSLFTHYPFPSPPPSPPLPSRLPSPTLSPLPSQPWYRCGHGGRSNTTQANWASTHREMRLWERGRRLHSTTSTGNSLMSQRYALPPPKWSWVADMQWSGLVHEYIHTYICTCVSAEVYCICTYVRTYVRMYVCKMYGPTYVLWSTE